MARPARQGSEHERVLHAEDINAAFIRTGDRVGGAGGRRRCGKTGGLLTAGVVDRRILDEDVRVGEVPTAPAARLELAAYGNPGAIVVRQPHRSLVGA